MGCGELLGAAPPALAVRSEESEGPGMLAAADQLHEERLAEGGIARWADTAALLAPS